MCISMQQNVGPNRSTHKLPKMFNKGAKAIQYTIFAINDAGTMDIHFQKREEALDSYLTPHTKLHQKWIIGLCVKPNTITLLEEKRKENLSGHGLGQDFLKKT